MKPFNMKPFNIKNGHQSLMLSAALISAIAFTGCAEQEEITDTTEPPTNVMNEVIDSDVTMRVRKALLNDDSLQKFDITVVTRKGDVLVTGEVGSKNMIDHVKNLVIRVEGVHSLHEHLTINAS
ncbi:MAG: osmotically-inducible protein OsmY [Motiliproteus sp.]|jgi:osmotically-inducible protein OsmY